MNMPLVKRSIRAENERNILEAAERIFAEAGFEGASTAAIARRAGVPKANLHYYFATKQILYRAVIERVLTAWLEAARSFDESDDPAEALSRYIGAKMDLARSMPLGARIWTSEIMRGAPVIQDFSRNDLDELGAVAVDHRAELDRARHGAADRAEVSFLYDLGHHSALFPCRP
jgi:TetR/AcrR family transcriptional regulator